MNGAESLVRTLTASGVTVCFANPGTSEMHFVAALDKVPEMRPVLEHPIRIGHGVVRHQLERRTKHVGAEGAILDSPVQLSVHEYEVAENHQDLVAESSVLASALVRYHRAETLPPVPGMVLMLNGKGTTTRRRSTR